MTLSQADAASVNCPGFGRVHATLQRFIDAQVLPGVSLAVLQGEHLVHRACLGWADIERAVPLREDHLYRIFSNSKLVTTCAVLLLVDEGLLSLDDPVARYLPMLANPRVLRPGAVRLDDTEAAARDITVRHLLTHTAGYSYAHARPGSLLGEAYEQQRILLDENQSLEAFVHALAPLPLLFQPGSAWEYSVCSDVLARLIEVISKTEFSQFLRERIFDPLGMRDTGFWVEPAAAHRLVGFYRGRHPEQPFRGGLERCDEIPFVGAFLAPRALRSGGGGLVSSLGDMTKLMRSLSSPRHALLSVESRNLLVCNQLPDGTQMRFPRAGSPAGRGYSVAGAVTLRVTAIDPPETLGELQWGGIAGTHWWYSPATGTAAVLMTQRYLSFWHLFAFQARREIYAALRARR